MRVKELIIFVILCVLSTAVIARGTHGQTQNFGWPYIKNFSSHDYNVNSEIWSIAQDPRGFMYFGTNEGVLEFDGETWRLIRLPNGSAVRSLCLDARGRVFVTGSSDFGYLAPDSIGQLSFVSLLPFMEKKDMKFGEVWDVVAAFHGIYFKTHDKVYRWTGDKIDVIEPVNSYRLYLIDDVVYARDDGNGLVEISADSTRLIPDGETFAHVGVYNMVPFDDQVLITTSQNGLFLYDGIRFSPFKTAADSILTNYRIYNVCALENGKYAYALRRGGAVILDQRGVHFTHFTTASGLKSNAVFDVFPDNQGGLWLATNEGITRIEISSPLSLLPKENVGNGQITHLQRFDNTLFASNVYGIFYLDKSGKNFKAIPEIKSTGDNFVVFDNHLLSSTITDICAINTNFETNFLLEFEGASLFQSTLDSSIIYCIDRSGVAFLHFTVGALQLLEEPIAIDEELISLVEDPDGSLWIETYYEGVIHLKRRTAKQPPFQDSSQIKLTYFNRQNGLPGNHCRIFSIAGQTRFATDVGLFKFAAANKSFVPDSILGDLFTRPSCSILLLVQNHLGDLWILAQSPAGYELGKAVRQNNGRYLWQPDAQLQRIDLSTVLAIYPDFNDNLQTELLWISTSEGLIQYNLSANRFANFTSPAYIRGVFINEDSLIFAGSADMNGMRHFNFDAATQRLTFQFSAPGYDKTEANQYQYRLEGNDEQWSQWIAESRKEYTNLAAGEYLFHVRAKNVYGKVGPESTISFTIFPAWYFSSWAISIYVLLFLAFLYQVRRWELKRINKKHGFQLERIEFSKLKELDRLKSQFYTNISHEFRTPLTLILGQTESVLSSSIANREKGKLQVAIKNARRLLSLINELLDISKLEAGSMELKARSQNLVSFLKSLFYSFESFAEAQKIILNFASESEHIPVLFEAEKMEKIFYNLISNALKFTASGGQVNVTLKKTTPSQVEIYVSDNGSGIEPEHLPHIFNRFYQADASDTREHEGTGIGLALTKELVELHKGTISVQSTKGLGSSFKIVLPCSQDDGKSIEAESPAAPHSSPADFPGTEETGSVEIIESPANQLADKGKDIILIVEDNRDVHAYIKEQLVRDYQVVASFDGQSGLENAEAVIPDLIITDVMMPKMDGYEFSRKIKGNEKTSHIPVIMLTARASHDDKIEGLETGVDAYLTKPFSAKELQVRVKNLIYQRRQLRKRFSKATIIKPSEVSSESVEQLFLEKTVKLIEASFEDENFGPEILAEKLFMSLSQLNRKMRALIDQPAGQLIRSLRLQRAADLLKQNAGSVAEICYQLGFNDQAYFSRVFKKHFKCSPSEYKKIKF